MLKGGKRPGCLEYPVSSSSSCLRIAVLCFGNHAFAFLKSKILLLNYFWKQDMTLFMSQFLPMSDLVKCQCFFFFVDQRLFCICSSTGVCCFQLNPTVYLERLLAVSSLKTADSLVRHVLEFALMLHIDAGIIVRRVFEFTSVLNIEVAVCFLMHALKFA